MVNFNLIGIKINLQVSDKRVYAHTEIKNKLVHRVSVIWKDTS